MSERPSEIEDSPSERARQSAYLEFMTPGELPPGARVREAEERLGEALAKELGVAIESGAAPPARSRAPRARGFRFALAAAAAVIVVAGASYLATSLRAPREPLLRGTSSPATPGGWNARPTHQALVSGAAQLEWSPAPGADSYTLVFLSSDLSELARVSGLLDTSYVLDATSRPATVAPGTQALWRVVAYQGKDEVGRSQASPIAIP